MRAGMPRGRSRVAECCVIEVLTDRSHSLRPVWTEAPDRRRRLVPGGGIRAERRHVAAFDLGWHPGAASHRVEPLHVHHARHVEAGPPHVPDPARATAAARGAVDRQARALGPRRRGQAREGQRRPRVGERVAPVHGARPFHGGPVHPDPAVAGRASWPVAGGYMGPRGAAGTMAPVSGPLAGVTPTGPAGDPVRGDHRAPSSLAPPAQ